MLGIDFLNLVWYIHEPMMNRIENFLSQFGQEQTRSLTPEQQSIEQLFTELKKVFEAHESEKDEDGSITLNGVNTHEKVRISYQEQREMGEMPQWTIVFINQSDETSLDHEYATMILKSEINSAASALRVKVPKAVDRNGAAIFSVYLTSNTQFS